MKEDAFFTVSEAAEAIGGTFYPDDAAERTLSQTFRVDSREISPGDVFIAVKGARVDGHDYIERAAASGASAVILERAYFEANEDALKKISATLLVAKEGERSEEAAVRLARAWLERVSPKTVGITGSVGKTTTRELLAGVLRGRFRVHAAKKSYNTLIGCSMTILAMPAPTEILILELGTNRPGEIADLVAAFPVEYGLITEVSPAHLEGLGSIEGVCAAKMEIVRSSAIKFLSYNFDNEILNAAVSRIRPEIRRVGVGSGGGDVRITNVTQQIGRDGSPRLFLEISHDGRTFACNAALYGKQNARNVAYAYAIASEFGLSGESDKTFAGSLEGVSLPSGRGGVERLPGGGLLIDDTYNANPDSVSYALRNVIELDLPEGVRRVAVLGGMRELGAESKHWHEVVMSRAGLFDEVHLVGSEWDDVETKQASLAGKWRGADDFIAKFDFTGTADSAILVKGSRYYELERLLPYFRGEKGGERA